MVYYNYITCTMTITVDYKMCQPFQGAEEKGHGRKKKGMTEGEI